MPFKSYKKLSQEYGYEILRLRKQILEMKSVIKQQADEIDQLNKKYKAGFYTYRERVSQLEAKLKEI
jgi:hypothetical protein